MPAKRPITIELFGDVRIDDYAWLRDREDPGVLELLEAERAHAEAVVDARTPGLRERLYAEMRARIKEDDSSVPCKDGPWLYYSRTELGDEYPRHCRRPVGDGPEHELLGPPLSAEQLFLDENELAAESDYFELGSMAMSPNHRRCAYTVDLDGDESYAIHVLDVETGEPLPEVLDGCGASFEWIDDEWLIYTRLDETLRPWQAWRHRLGGSIDDDVLIWEELDSAFFVSVYRSRSDAYVVVSLASQVTSEEWLISTATAEAAPQLVARRRSHVEYTALHHRDTSGREQLFVLTNDGARNRRIMLAPVPTDDHGQSWTEFMPVRADVLIEDLDVFESYLVVWERVDGLQRVRIVSLDPSTGDSASGHVIEFPDPTYSIWPERNPEFQATHLRFVYTSLTTPTSVYDYDPRERSRTLRKRAEVVGGHDPDDYASARIWATAPDGERVPISLVWKREAVPPTKAGEAVPPTKAGEAVPPT